ncbi:uncharacterized protein LOC121930524 isoform X2 [Sceloporus undulatus]|uniref:uncharacterized protein LOC121930524 isoform X2 n=1 Tax=Sceloporus undulatus TaxID=8520 RepID=UPI001C4B2897|nr:uncharacterized protein LOC121930524 isoform X2 [Sceloporus undulatus]
MVPQTKKAVSLNSRTREKTGPSRVPFLRMNSGQDSHPELRASSFLGGNRAANAERAFSLNLSPMEKGREGRGVYCKRQQGISYVWLQRPRPPWLLPLRVPRRSSGGRRCLCQRCCPRAALLLLFLRRRPFKQPGLLFTRRAGRASRGLQLLRPTPPDPADADPLEGRKEGPGSPVPQTPMDPPREDPLMLLRGSWVEVAPFGAPDQEEDQEEDLRLEAILREAQMEPSPSAPEPQQQHRRGGGAPPASKDPPRRNGAPPERRKTREAAHCATLDWPWPSPPEPRLPPRSCPAWDPRPAPPARPKRGLRDPQVLLLVGPSLLLSHVLALGLGICLGKRLAASSSQRHLTTRDPLPEGIGQPPRPGPGLLQLRSPWKTLAACETTTRPWGKGAGGCLCPQVLVGSAHPLWIPL